MNELADRAAREAALDTTQSLLVQAPAGSGKTELLALRILKLLAQVDEPEQVLGITFTKAATAEMRRRILSKLEAAKDFERTGGPSQGGEPDQFELARAVLEHSERRGWRILEQPGRLNITTIDALCLSIVRQTPLRAGLCGVLSPIEDARLLYRGAARKTFDRLGGEDRGLNSALRDLLLLRDSNLENCEGLLAEMLSRRDQWRHAFPLAGSIEWSAAREQLERPFQAEIDRVLTETRSILCSHPVLADELLDLARYACRSAGEGFAIQKLASSAQLPPASFESVDAWLCVCELLLTQRDEPRKGFNVNQGFPAKDNGEKTRMKSLVRSLEQVPGLFDRLREVRALPPARYAEHQWHALRSIFTALRQAVRELESVFAEERAVDFVEIGMAALDALHADSASLLKGSVRHLLVDEFQDTSRRQHDLIAELVRHWHSHDGRTLFLVGDPMQSIYMFRQAEVELFGMVQDHGIATANGPLAIRTVRLETNFRSSSGVVEPLNTMFQAVFPHQRREGAAGVEFLPSVANRHGRDGNAFVVHPNFLSRATKIDDADDVQLPAEARRLEVTAIMEVVRRHLPKIAEAQREGEEYTVAVLGRTKEHLFPIAGALREEGIPFRAVEIETLAERQEVLDLQSLTRALLHPLDRIAWLAVLRSPWCGLTLRELHLLYGTDDRRAPRESVRYETEKRLHLLDQASRARVDRVLTAIEAAQRARYSYGSLGLWVERVWRGLNGPDCLDSAGYENALAYFGMLESIAPDGIEATGEAMDDRLNRLFASPDPAASERSGVQLMTIHKAKGLGFHVVLLPALQRRIRPEEPAFIQHLERFAEAGTELLVAPIGATGEETSALNRWIRGLKDSREAEERKRLLYVACTRAREEVHLFATDTVTNSGLSGESGSLLDTAWPALGEIFEHHYARQQSIPERKVTEFPGPVERASSAKSDTVPAIAASAASTLLRRLPLDRHTKAVSAPLTASVAIGGPVREAMEDNTRPNASYKSRTLGTIVHALLEIAARKLANGVLPENLLDSLTSFRTHASALASQSGLTSVAAEQCGNEAAAAIRSMLEDNVGRWVLHPHTGSQNEISWTGAADGVSRVLRIDRTFFAGPEPCAEGTEYLWIIDYKTADHSASGVEEFLELERSLYEEQLENYGRTMRMAHGESTQLRLGLYYPLLKRLIWWPA